MHDALARANGNALSTVETANSRGKTQILVGPALKRRFQDVGQVPRLAVFPCHAHVRTLVRRGVETSINETLEPTEATLS